MALHLQRPVDGTIGAYRMIPERGRLRARNA